MLCIVSFRVNFHAKRIIVIFVAPFFLQWCGLCSIICPVLRVIMITTEKLCTSYCRLATGRDIQQEMSLNHVAFSIADAVLCVADVAKISLIH